MFAGLWGRRDAPWDGSQMPSQRGKVALVTGANSGIGFAAAKKLAERGATVVLACRSEGRGHEAEALIAQHLQQYQQEARDDDDGVGSVEFMQVDMGELASIFRFARRFRDRFEKLDLLINNAGVSMPSQKRTTDGLESQFGVNHIGAFYLTRLLFDMLKKAPAARVVAVSSIAHRSAKLDFETIATGENASSWADFTGYANSKIANLLFTYELDRRLKKKGIRSVKAVAAHPGLTHTAIFAKYIIDWMLPRFLQWLLLKILFALPFNTVEIGVLPIMYAATVESVQSGEYYGPDSFGGRRGYPTREISTPASYSKDDARQLWTLSEEIVEGRFDVQ